MRRLGWARIEAMRKAQENRLRPDAKDIQKRRKKINRTGWVKHKARKRPQGFNAFEVKERVITEDGETIDTSRIVAPETGIHSLEWAARIVPQSSGFLRLPIEIRKQIYGLVFADSIVSNPRKNGQKYTTFGGVSPAIQQYNALSEICRQTWVDVVGGGVLYTYARFSFSSPDTMTRYLNSINPAHRDVIRDIQLNLSFTASSSSIPTAALALLGSLPDLQSLTLVLNFRYILCENFLPPAFMPFWGMGTQGRKCRVRGYILQKIRNCNWENISGLRSFEMEFVPVVLNRPPWAPPDDWRTRFVSTHATHVQLRDEIKAIVTRE